MRLAFLESDKKNVDNSGHENILERVVEFENLKNKFVLVITPPRDQTLR